MNLPYFSLTRSFQWTKYFCGCVVALADLWFFNNCSFPHKNKISPTFSQLLAWISEFPPPNRKFPDYSLTLKNTIFPWPWERYFCSVVTNSGASECIWLNTNPIITLIMHLCTESFTEFFPSHKHSSNFQILKTNHLQYPFLGKLTHIVFRRSHIHVIKKSHTISFPNVLNQNTLKFQLTENLQHICAKWAKKVKSWING